MFVKPQDKIVPTPYVIAMRDLGNRDGAGAMYVENGRVIIRKTVAKTESEVTALWEDVKDLDVAFHLRSASRGVISEENAHPYWVCNQDWGDKIDVALMHNGTIPNVQVDPTMSDTYNLATYFLRPYLCDFPQAYNSPKFWNIVSALIGGNKLILLNNKGKFVVVNPGEGRMMNPPGIWVSSLSRLNVRGETVNLSTVHSEKATIYGWWKEEGTGFSHFRTQETT